MSVWDVLGDIGGGVLDVASVALPVVANVVAPGVGGQIASLGVKALGTGLNAVTGNNYASSSFISAKKPTPVYNTATQTQQQYYTEQQYYQQPQQYTDNTSKGAESTGGNMIYWGIGAVVVLAGGYMIFSKKKTRRF